MSPKQTQRTNGIMVRVNDTELRRFQKQAGYEPMAAWARRILLEYCDRREKSQRKGARGLPGGEALWALGGHLLSATRSCDGSAHTGPQLADLEAHPSIVLAAS